MPAGVRLLGSLEVTDAHGKAIDIGGAQPRVVLAMLVAADGRAVGVDVLIDAIWDEAPPASAAGSLQTYVSRLRRVLAAIGAEIVREPGGYRLDIDPLLVDVHRFEALVERGVVALADGDPCSAREALVDAERLWRGPALLEVSGRSRIAGIARRLEDRRLAAVEDRVAAEMALGRHAELVAELAQLVGEHPLRERLWELLALARYRSGLQADALRAIADARTTLVDALGVDPGAGLRRLEQAILEQDPTLDLSPMPGQATVAVSVSVDRRDVASDAPELVGRDEELAAMSRALDAVVDGGSCMAVVQGEAGVGKTRLCEELAVLAGQRDGTVVWGRCLGGGAAPAYWPWITVLRELRVIADRGGSDGSGAAANAVDQLIDASGALPASAGAVERPPLLDGVLDLVRRSRGSGPVVLVFEDVQWADVESIELLADVASGPLVAGVLVVLTLRDGEDADRDEVVSLLAAVSRRPGTRRLHLAGLSCDGTAALLRSVAGIDVDGAYAEVVHERCDGNPFFAIELQRLLDAEGVTDAGMVGTVAVPAGVADVIRQRLRGLPPATMELLQVAALAGRDLDVGLVSAVLDRPLDECIDDLDAAVEHRLLVDGGPFNMMRFSHTLVREVVEGELSPLRRARTHLAIADAIIASGRDDQVEIVAEHLWAAVPVGAARRAADALDRAAQVAIRRFAVGAASGMLERSLQLRRAVGGGAAGSNAELDSLVNLVWALRARGGYRSALEHYGRGAELARHLGRRDIELEMQWSEWAGHDTACDFDHARPVATRFRAWAESSDDPLVRVAGHTAWAIQCWHDGELAASAASFALSAQARSELTADHADVSLTAELVVLSSSFGLYVGEQVGAFDQPDEVFAQAAEAVSGNFPVAIIWCMACTSAMSGGDLERVERCARRVLDAESGETLGFWGSQARMYLGAALVATGRAEQGRVLFDAGRAGYRAGGLRTGVALMLAAAVSAEVGAGDLDRAGEHLASAQHELAHGERWPEPFVLMAEADLVEAAGGTRTEVAAKRSQAVTVARSQGAVVAAECAQRTIEGRPWLHAVGGGTEQSVPA